jgi:hypothetical protein
MPVRETSANLGLIESNVLNSILRDFGIVWQCNLSTPVITRQQSTALPTTREDCVSGERQTVICLVKHPRKPKVIGRFSRHS